MSDVPIDFQIADLQARMSRIVARLSDFAEYSPERHVLTQQFQHLSMIEEYARTHGKLPPIVE